MVVENHVVGHEIDQGHDI